jgi:HEAT repeat protein
MGHWKLRVVTFVVLLLLAGIIWHLSSREPLYLGKRVTQYLDDMATNWPALRQDDPGLKAIYEMGPATIPYLRKALRRQNSFQEKALGFIRARGPRWIVTRLPNSKSQQYFWGLSGAAADGLALFGPRARDALPDLLEQFNGSMPNYAYYAVLEIGPTKECLPILVELMHSTNWAGPLYATRFIGMTGITNAAVLTVLSEAAQDKLPATVKNRARVREAAIDAIGELGPKAQSAAPLLAQNLQDQDAAIMIASARALWLIQGKTNPPVALLTRLLDDAIHGPSTVTSFSPGGPKEHLGPNEFNKLHIMEMLGEMGDAARPALGSLREVKSHDEIVFLRFLASEALWKINHETNDLVPICRLAFQDSEPGVQGHAAKLLAEVCIDEHLMLPDFEQMLTSSIMVERMQAARALWKLSGRTDDVVPVLIAGLKDHFTFYSNADVRQVAADTLGEMGPRAGRAVPDLLKTLCDERENVRKAATNALKAVDRKAAAKAGLK